MVGIPGRSKGCNTCRKRRVKCDEAKPICHRCNRAGFECLGYGRETIWRHTSTAPFPSQIPAIQITGFPSQPLAQSMDFPKRRDTKRFPAAAAPPPELSLIAFQGDMHYAFLFENFIWRSYGKLWLEQAAEGKLGGLSQEAAEALARSHFGRSNKQAEIQLKGQATYGKCLKTLAGELGNVMGLGSEKTRGQLIVPVLILMLYSSSLADQIGTVHHLKGVAKLLYLCGPEAFQRQPLLSAFDAARATLTVASLISRQRLFLDEPKWRSVPWALDPAAKSASSRLLDILVIMPALLEDHAQLESATTATTISSSSSSSSSSPSSSPSAPIDPAILLASILSRLETQLETLYRWRWRWQVDSGHEVTPDPSCPHSVSDQDPDLVFSRVGGAAEISLYNAVLMWLLALLWKTDPLGAGPLIRRCADSAASAFSSSSSSATSSFHPLRRPGDTVGVRDPAREVVRVLSWQSRHRGREAEPTVLYLFPVGMALAVLEDDAAAVADIARLLGRSAVTKGYAGAGGGRNVADFGFYITQESLQPGGDGIDVPQERRLWRAGEEIGAQG